MSKRRRVEVDWIDSVGAGGWHVPEDVETFCNNPGPVLHSLGYVEKRTKHYLIIVQSIHGTNRGGLLAIPHPAVLKVTPLKGGSHE